MFCFLCSHAKIYILKVFIILLFISSLYYSQDIITFVGEVYIAQIFHEQSQDSKGNITICYGTLGLTESRITTLIQSHPYILYIGVRIIQLLLLRFKNTINSPTSVSQSKRHHYLHQYHSDETWVYVLLICPQGNSYILKI